MWRGCPERAADSHRPPSDIRWGRTLDGTDGLAEQAGDATDPGGLDVALERAVAGDESGFAVVWQALHPSLLRYLGARGEQSPEDLASETWVQVVRGLADFSGDSMAFRAWLFAIARNRAIDHGRARARRPVLVCAPEPAGDASLFDGPGVASAEDEVLRQESTRSAIDLLATLPAAQAEMVALRVVAGLDVAEVARLVGRRPGTVRVTVHRALKSLAAHPDLRPAPAPPTLSPPAPRISAPKIRKVV